MALISDVDNGEDYDTHVVSEATSKLLQDIENLIAADAKRCVLVFSNLRAGLIINRASETLPSATKILQPKDNHLISSDHFIIASPDFVAKSDHLYNGKQLLEQYVFFFLLLMYIIVLMASQQGTTHYRSVLPWSTSAALACVKEGYC